MVITHRDLFAPSFYRVWNDVIAKKYPEIWLAGGRGCVDGDMPIDTPYGKVKIRDFRGGDIYAFDGHKIIVCQACRPVRYTKEVLFEIITESGKRILATDEHRFLTPDGWKKTLELVSGSLLEVVQPVALQSASYDIQDSPKVSCEKLTKTVPSSSSAFATLDSSTARCNFQTISDDQHKTHCVSFQSESLSDVRHLMRKLLGCLYRYLSDFRLYDGLFPTEEETYLDVFQLLADAPGRIHKNLHMDAQEKDETHIHEKCDILHSKQGCRDQLEDKCLKASESEILQMLSVLLSRIFPSEEQYLSTEDLDGSIQLIVQHLLSSISNLDSSESGPFESGASFPPKDYLEVHNLRMLSDMLLHKVHDESFSYSFNLKGNSKTNGTEYTKYDRILSIAKAKEDFYYDMFVPFYNNYISNGIINHNSTKSSFVSTAIILLMEMNPRLHCVCFRKYAANLADSVYSQFEFTINQKLRPLAGHWAFKKSPLKIVNVNTGQQILFRGLDDPQKVKSLKAPFGYFGLTWFEELAEFDCIEEVRNVNQSLHRGGHYFQTFCSYNPPETTSNWVNYEASVPQIVDGTMYRKVYRSDYRSVPEEWLGKNFFIEAELLKNTNPRAYAHEYLGEVTGNGGAIFPNVKPMTMTDEMISHFDHRHFGLDFGFAIDPAAFASLHYDKTRRSIYIYDEIYEIEMTNMALAEVLKTKELGFDYVMCDSAEPKSIAELESLGINVLPAQKGPDSVRFSTKFLQSLCNIYIDPIRCPNAYREFSQYEYDKNKSGQFISKFPDKNNHVIDGVRYALMEEAISAGLF